ncbi:hypothetical protein ACLOJK_038170 [Asimina triloba]
MGAHMHQAACTHGLYHGAPMVLHHLHEMAIAMAAVGVATTTRLRRSQPLPEQATVATTPPPSPPHYPSSHCCRRQRRPTVRHLHCRYPPPASAPSDDLSRSSRRQQRALLRFVMAALRLQSQQRDRDNTSSSVAGEFALGSDLTVDQRQGVAHRFLLRGNPTVDSDEDKPIIVFASEAWISRSRPFIISAITASPARRRRLRPTLPTATARATHVPPPVLPTLPLPAADAINGHDWTI